MDIISKEGQIILSQKIISMLLEQKYYNKQKTSKIFVCPNGIS